MLKKLTLLLVGIGMGFAQFTWAAGNPEKGKAKHFTQSVLLATAQMGQETRHSIRRELPVRKSGISNAS